MCGLVTIQRNALLINMVVKQRLGTSTPVNDFQSRVRCITERLPLIAAHQAPLLSQRESLYVMRNATSGNALLHISTLRRRNTDLSDIIHV